MSIKSHSTIFESPDITIAASEIVIPDALATVIWKNPHKQGTPEARQESLLQCMEAIWVSTFVRVREIWPQGFISTPDIHAAESEVERVQALVLSGKAKLADFRTAAEAWEKTILKKINPPIIEGKC